MRIHLTDTGARVHEKAMCGLDPIVAATGLSPADFQRLQRDLRVLRDNLMKASE